MDKLQGRCWVCGTTVQRSSIFHSLFFFVSCISPPSISAVIQELREELKALQSYLDAANEEIQVLFWVKECTTKNVPVF